MVPVVEVGGQNPKHLPQSLKSIKEAAEEEVAYAHSNVLFTYLTAKDQRQEQSHRQLGMTEKYYKQ